MPKANSLSTADRRALSAARNVLARLGVDFPTAVRRTAAEQTYKPTNDEIKRFINALNINKQVVVSINGDAGRFTVSTIEGYLNRRAHAQRMTKSRLNKKS